MLYQLAGILEGQLLLNVGIVGFHCLDAQMQLFGDLTGAVAVADKPEDLEFPIGEFRHWGTLSDCGTADELLHHLLRHAVADVYLATQDLAYGYEDALRGFPAS
jgi:hypothetical protein